MTREDLDAIEPERYELTERRQYRSISIGATSCASSAAAWWSWPRCRAPSGRSPVAARRDAASPRTSRRGCTSTTRGRVTVYTGKVEIGQNIRTSLAQAVADELRVPVTTIAMVMGDTDLVPFDAGTFGSMSTPRMGRQLSRAAAAAREMLIDAAAADLHADRATLTARDGHIVSAAGQSVASATSRKAAS